MHSRYWAAVVVAASALLLLSRIGIGQTEAAGEKKPAVQHELITEPDVRPVEYRGYVKQAMQSHLSAFGLVLTYRAPHREHLPIHAAALASLAGAHEVLYPEGSNSPRTSASIWSEPDTFGEALKKTTEAANRLQTAVDGGNQHLMLDALVRLGDSCENCHARFRQDGE